MAELVFSAGLNETDPDEIGIEECLDGENFLIDSRDKNFVPRPAQQLIDTATNAKPIRGIMQMIARAGTVTTVVKAGEQLYSWDGSTFTTERSTDITTASRYRSTHWSLDDILVMTDLDKNDPVFKWDGTSVLRMKTGLVSGSASAVSQISRSGQLATAIQSTHGFTTSDLVTIAGSSESEYNGEYEITVLDGDQYTYTVTGSPATPVTTSITADLGVELKAKYSVVKDNRVWLFNINTDSTELPHAILASKFEDPENFDTAVRGTSQDATSTFTATTKSDPFFLLSPDLRPINGAVLFFGAIVISTEGGRLYRLTGTDPTDYNFVDYYSGSAADANQSMINIGNDVMYVKKGFDVEKLTDTERSGDVSADDASTFIPASKQCLDDPIGVYDQANQRAVWFGTGCVLVYDKNVAALTPNLSPWAKWTTLMTNEFSTEAATFLRRPGKTTNTIYWGDAVGNIYDLNGTDFAGDAGAYSIESYRKTRYVSEAPSNYSMIEGRVRYQRLASATLILSFQWGEEYNETSCYLPLGGPVITGDPNFWGETDLYWGETEYWGEGEITGSGTLDDQVSTVGFSAVGRSPGFFLTTRVNGVANFKIHKIII